MTRRERLTPWLLLIPLLLGLLLFKLTPIVFGVGRSLYATSFSGSGGSHFVGLGNFADLFTDPTFWNALRVTLVFNVIVNPLQTALALGLALLVNASVRGVGVFRSIFFIPVAVPLAVAAVLWGLALDSQSGLINGLLISLHLPAQPFLDSREQALGSIIAIASWKGVGYWMIFFLAGLQDIPRSVYEAAAIDGASAWQQFARITLPLLRRVTAFVLMADTAANMLLFAPVQILTGGGPGNSTDLLMFESYRSGVQGLDMGRASAITVVLLLLLLATVLVQRLILREDAV